MELCGKCNGSGKYLNFGVCFSCGGTGKNTKQRGRRKFKAGDVIRKNSTGVVYDVERVTNREYICYTRNGAGRGQTARLGRFIDRYPVDSKEGYTIIEKKQVYKVLHDKYSGHFMYYDTEVTIEDDNRTDGRILVRSTYGTRGQTALVSPEEIEKLEGEFIEV